MVDETHAVAHHPATKFAITTRVQCLDASWHTDDGERNLQNVVSDGSMTVWVEGATTWTRLGSADSLA